MSGNRTSWGARLRRAFLVFMLLASTFLAGDLVALGQPGPGEPVRSLAAARASLKGSDSKSRDLDSAEKAIWGVLSSAPDNQEALTLLGTVRGRQERYAEAEALFRRVLQLNPKSAEAARNLAGALLAQDKPDEALQQYQQAIVLSPRDSNLRMLTARLELERGDFSGALSTLDGIPAASFPAPAIPMKAASLLGVDRKADAEALIPRVKGSAGAALDLADVFVTAGDSPAALRTLGFLVPIPKTDAARVYYLKGRAQRQQGETAPAMASFRQALAANPKSVETLLAMAEVSAAENKHAESLATLQKARELQPDSTEVLRHYVAEAMKAGENEKGAQAALELQKKSTALDDRYLAATVMVQQRQYLPATHILEDYVAQRPKDARALLGLGMGYLGLLRYAEAREALERSLALDPNVAESHYQMGLLASQQGDRAGAIQHWKKAAELQPRHAAALFFLGTMALESGDLTAAESDFRRSLEVDPNNMKTEYNLALVLNKLGKADEAKPHLERYRKMQEMEHATGGNPAAEHP